MKKLVYATVISACALYFPAVFAKNSPILTVKAEGIGNNGYIGPEYAFCVPSPKGHVKEGQDKSIGLSWSKGPEGTQSYAVIAVDPDVPTVFDDAGKEGKTLSKDMPRKNFYHWVLLDIPASITSIPAGADSDKLSPHGKSRIKTAYGMRGINDYAPYFASQPERRGIYAGYDGPCPPWNDERVHHYHFKVFALDMKSLGVSGTPPTGDAAMKAIEKHTLAQGEAVGKYTLNPSVKKQ